MRMLIMCCAAIFLVSNIYANNQENIFDSLLEEASASSTNHALRDKIEKAFYQTCVSGAIKRQSEIAKKYPTEPNNKDIWQSVKAKCDCIAKDVQLTEAFIQLAKASNIDEISAANHAEIRLANSLQQAFIQCTHKEQP